MLVKTFFLLISEIFDVKLVESLSVNATTHNSNVTTGLCILGTRSL